MTTPLMTKTDTVETKVRIRLFRRERKEAGGGGGFPPAPPGSAEFPREHGKHNHKCDQCHVAEAAYEIEVGDLISRLYLCAHHYRKQWVEFAHPRYKVKDLRL